MSNTFWAVFFGSSIGTFVVHFASTLVDEWQYRQRHKRVRDVFELLEDSEYEDYV